MYLILILLLFPVIGFAQFPKEFERMKCKSEIRYVLKKHGSLNKWRRLVNAKKGIFTFNSPTKKIGRWVELHGEVNPTLYIFEANKTTLIRWGKSSCDQYLNQSYPSILGKGMIDNGLTDKALYEIVKKREYTLIYIWSPDMIYSVREMDVLIKAAKDLNIKFLPVHSHNSNFDDVRKSMTKFKLKLRSLKLNSIDLLMRDNSFHYPVSYLVGYGKVSSRIFGVMPRNKFTEEINKKISELKVGEAR